MLVSSSCLEYGKGAVTGCAQPGDPVGRRYKRRGGSISLPITVHILDRWRLLGISKLAINPRLESRILHSGQSLP